MFLGHFGLALAAKRAEPALPLAVLLVVSVAPDLLDPLLSIAGQDGSALTHTAPACLAFALVAGAVAGWIVRRWSAALTCAALAASHFLTDLLTSRLELWPGGPQTGLGLYGAPWLDFTLEAAMILLGWFLYRETLPVRRRNHPVAFGILGGLIALQAAVAAIGIS